MFGANSNPKKAVQIIECMMTNFISLKDDWIDGAILRLPENRSPRKKEELFIKIQEKYSNLKADKNDFFSGLLNNRLKAYSIIFFRYLDRSDLRIMKQFQIKSKFKSVIISVFI